MNRTERWNQLETAYWDLIVIGGGITGAGILREAVRSGLRAVLLEQRDFAWGTSSRSSKLVHGGLRYLKEGRILLTRASVQEREHLLRDAPGLVEPLGFLQTVYEGDSPGRWMFEIGLTIYDLLALQWDHQYYAPEDFRLLAPHIAEGELQGGFRFADAQTDDARLVLRVLAEAQDGGGLALNYARVTGLLYAADGLVNGVRVQDETDRRTCEIHATAVVNATGAWVDGLRREVGAPGRIRPLRGSHLLFPAWRLPTAQAISLLHPFDGRPVFIVPWEGVTLVGTTDVDHTTDLQEEPVISPQEVAYLLAAVEAVFPARSIGLQDVLSTFAGVRPVIGSGALDPSKESRDHVIWEESGLLTVTGGKLTTFRLIAQQALEALRARFPGLGDLESAGVLDPTPEDVDAPGLEREARRRLIGRYGAHARDLVAAAQPGELAAIPGTRTLWAELRWAARDEQVCHLDDLLLRRTRLGLLLPGGAQDLLSLALAICAEELGWGPDRQAQEAAAYRRLWQRAYGLPAPETIPDWRKLLAQAHRHQVAQRQQSAQRRRIAAVTAGLLGAGVGGLLAVWFLRRHAKIKHAERPDSLH
jgi:glycerol-3-phosphate dehydrogenase